MNLLIIRLVIFVVLFWAGLKLYRMYREWKLAQDEDAQHQQSLDNGRMVRCTYCKVHLPEDEALRQNDRWFCSSEHRDRFLEQQPPS